MSLTLQDIGFANYEEMRKAYDLSDGYGDEILEHFLRSCMDTVRLDQLISVDQNAYTPKVKPEIIYTNQNE